MRAVVGMKGGLSEVLTSAIRSDLKRLVYRMLVSLALGLLVFASARAQEGSTPPQHELVVHMVRYWTQYLEMERGYLQMVCTLDAEQQARLAKGSEQVIEDLRVALSKAKITPGGIVVNPEFRYQKGVVATLNLAAIVNQGYEEVLETVLNADQLAKYREELARRDEFRTKLAALTILQRLDRKLRLSAEQRASLERPIQEWAKSHLHHLSNLNADPDLIPLVPDAVIGDHLNEVQLSVWQRSEKRDLDHMGFSS